MTRTVAPGAVTLVLPAYNERDNVAPLLSELVQSDTHKHVKRVIYVDDDSPDGTSEYIKSTAFPLEVLCLHRIGRQGLSSAVAEGMLLADTEYLAVMDADGQHSPRDLMKMIATLESTGADIVIGSRFKDTEQQPSHTGLRQALSRLGNRASRLLLRKTLTDPLTGFFLIRRSLFLDAARAIRPTGFKILLDILYALRARGVVLAEVQIDFRRRHAGESKLDSAVILEFMDQVLNRLSGGIVPEKFLGFAIVGGSGVLVHLAALYFFLFTYGAGFVASQTVATGLAMVWNYALNNRLTFRRNRKRGLQWLHGLLLFMAVCSAGALANVGVASVMNSSRFTWWVSGLAGVLVGTVFNFALSRFLVWRT